MTVKDKYADLLKLGHRGFQLASRGRNLRGRSRDLDAGTLHLSNE